jgi:hypothetical protein
VSILRRLWAQLAGRPAAQGSPRLAESRTFVDAVACASCRHFLHEPADIEAALPGLSVLSSGYASVRGRDGLCLKHDRFVTAQSCCPAFEERAVPA